MYFMYMRPPRWLTGKEPVSAGDSRDTDLIPVSKILWRRKYLPIPVFLPGKSHGYRNLAGYSS